jgi:hypothetical protein
MDSDGDRIAAVSALPGPYAWPCDACAGPGDTLRVLTASEAIETERALFSLCPSPSGVADAAALAAAAAAAAPDGAVER